MPIFQVFDNLILSYQFFIKYNLHQTTLKIHFNIYILMIIELQLLVIHIFYRYLFQNNHKIES